MQESTASNLLGAIYRLNTVGAGQQEPSKAQVVEQLNGFLCSIQKLASQDAALSKVLQFRIQGKKATQYVSKALEYTGPDKATADLLIERRQGWENNPATFYKVAMSPIPAHLMDPQAQIVGSCLCLDGTTAHAWIARRCLCIVLEKFRQKRGRRSAEEIARALHQAELSSTRTLQELTDFTQALIDAGSRYLCIEEDLGVGSIFLLGQDVPDNVWEMRLPKSGEVRKYVIDRLKEQQVPEMAKEYKTLRVLVVSHALAYYGVAEAVASPNWGANILTQMDLPGFVNGPNSMEWMEFSSG